jgi:hypothetical protein
MGERLIVSFLLTNLPVMMIPSVTFLRHSTTRTTVPGTTCYHTKVTPVNLPTSKVHRHVLTCIELSQVNRQRDLTDLRFAFSVYLSLSSQLLFTEH